MDRRELLKTGIIGSFFFVANKVNLEAFQTKKLNIIKPKKLIPGDRVGIVAPATFTPTLEEIDKATQAIQAMDLIPVFGKTFQDKTGWKTKSIELRVAELMEMFIDPNIKAIFCIRGGYGSIGLIDKLNYELIAKNPKIFVGFSDITTLLISIYQKTGLTTLHSPMLLSSYGESFDLLKKYLFTNEPAGLLKNIQNDNIRKRNYYTIKPGIAQGTLIGGNLSLITSLIGTKFEIQTNEKILFLEEVSEEPYRIDRMLHQLRLANKLDGLKALVFGLCNDCESKGNSIWDYSLLDVLNEHFSNKPYASFYGLNIGHTSNQIPLPIGLNCELNATEGTITILENYCE